ncbi:YggT family protein [Paenibacillus thiaminolyticus]|uniref:YggT family protein n=1 Tax=Paenibacillus thiaminolyticus TaxID=49283 RepID=UPI00232BD3B3|nr:YggT family protein [Paenibacillus thiaminolyticus]WCF10067.1 YggT family protein [Paenibacillus thiaminolyticus]WII39356.1 YggT family protein [Paenibacillus thiaminolyticus]
MLEYTMIHYLGYLYEIYRWLIIIYVLMSWLPNVRESFIGEILGKIVEPYLGLFRRIIPPIGGMLDISPIIAIFALHFVYMGLVAVVQYLF